MNTQEIGVVSWNILFDTENNFKTASQFERKNSLIQTLVQLSVPLDVVGCLEAEQDAEHGNVGKLIASATTGSDGYWRQHSRKTEMLGLFGALVEPPDVFELEGNRKLLVSHIEGIDFALLHLTFNPFGEKLRLRQMKQALEILKTSRRTVLMGDFNSASWQRSRRAVQKSGFTSVFHALDMRRPPTILSTAYHKKLKAPFRLALQRGIMPDEIYIRGVQVNAAGVFEGDSDHRGVWAKIII